MQIDLEAMKTQKPTSKPTIYLSLCAAVAAGVLSTTAHGQTGVSVAPVPATSGSHAFDSTAFARVPQDLDAVGYSEKEYFLSGSAKAYQYNSANPTDDSVSPVQAAPVAYVNRILVRAPKNPARFSGNVIFELTDDTQGSEQVIEWAHANSQFIRNGDAYVLLSSLPASAGVLKAFNPVRYSAINWPVVPATVSACGNGPEQGIIYDEITQLGTLLKSNSAKGPLPGLNVQRVFISGYSGAAVTLLTYDRVFGLNSRLFDGYFVDGGGTRALINGCESLAAAATRTQPPASTVSPVIQSQTASDIVFFTAVTGVPPHSPDSDASNNRYRYYEIAGASHVDGDILRGAPERSDVAFAPGPASFPVAVDGAICGKGGSTVINAFPNRYVDDALWANLEAWAIAGPSYAPPREASPLVIDSATLSGAQAQQGGVRSVAVDLPVDSYNVATFLPASAGTAQQSFCVLAGFQTPNGSAARNSAILLDAVQLYNQNFLTVWDLAALAGNPDLAYTYPDGTTVVPDTPPSH